jgi:hypothetical protein
LQHYLTLAPKCCRSVTTNNSPHSWKDEGHAFLSMEFESFYMKDTQGEVNHADGQVPKQRGDRIKCIHASQQVANA